MGARSLLNQACLFWRPFKYPKEPSLGATYSNQGRWGVAYTLKLQLTSMGACHIDQVQTWSPGPPCSLIFQVGQPDQSIGPHGFDPQPWSTPDFVCR